jgi:hypothetical protein
MQLWNVQQQITKHGEVYYEHLLKLISYLHVKATNVLFTTIFKACLLPYPRLTIAGMRRITLIEHKEAIIVCEESGPINSNYNVLLTTPETNIVVKHVVPIVIVKSTLMCINCCKIGHSVETCHNREKKRY